MTKHLAYGIQMGMRDRFQQRSCLYNWLDYVGCDRFDTTLQFRRTDRHQGQAGRSDEAAE